jgi:hypothetical protein
MRFPLAVISLILAAGLMCTNASGQGDDKVDVFASVVRSESIVV